MSKEIKKIRSFVEEEIQQAKDNKRIYGWMCKHFKNYYEGKISCCENLLMFIDTEFNMLEEKKDTNENTTN